MRVAGRQSSKFSRWMPPVTEPRPSEFAWGIGALLLPRLWVLLAAIRPLVLGVHSRLERQIRRVAAERAGEDIGTFARAFDRRAEPFDPWVVRSTWDALQPYLAFSGGCVPLRPTDRLGEDLLVDLDDVSFDLIPAVARRSGHTLENAKSNPLYGKIVTVGDLVRFITLQPMAGWRVTARIFGKR
jgi:hypothetical protein